MHAYKLLLILALLAPSSGPSLDNVQDLPKVWRKLAYCESRYVIDAVSPSGDHYGLFQIHKGFYKAVGIKWKRSTVSEQFTVAKYVYKRQGANAWACANYAGLK